MGYWLWKSDTKILTTKDIKSALVNSKAALFDNVYELMLREISDKDREFLLKMQGDPIDTQFGELAKRMKVTSSYASKYRQRLIQGGLIKPTVHGRIAYAPPYFKEFLGTQII
jgi:predicted transcriptional regulator